LCSPSFPLSCVPSPGFRRFGSFPPVWSIFPPSVHTNVVLEMYKEDGIILQYFRLGKHRSTTFGREEALVHFHLRHPSISRQHAAIIHTQQNDSDKFNNYNSSSSSSSSSSVPVPSCFSPSGLVVVDLHSFHGTYLNDFVLLSGEPYALYEGDIIRFGGSTRKYKVKALGNKKRRIEKDEKEEKREERNGKEKDKNEIVSLLKGTTEERKAIEARAMAKTGGGGGGMDGMDGMDRMDRMDGGASAPAKVTTKRRREENGSFSSHGNGAHSVGSSSSSNFSRPHRVRASHLLLKHTGSRNPSSHRGPITRSLAEARISMQEHWETLKEIEGGGNVSELKSRFSTMAKDWSDCSSWKRGGDLGVFEFGKMQPKFSEAAFSLSVGEISSIVETDSGVHIILRTE